ncbi:MAG: hypothetical protein LUD02_00445 [Tannerellaceae bacterium]|nr:hypothetical protein [Tannerellaceae bacterium]
MKKVLFVLSTALLVACTETPETKVLSYGWQGEGGNTTEQTLQNDFSKWKSHGLDGICYNAGGDVEKHTRAAKVAKANGMEYHAWIPTMVQGNVDPSWYAVNRNGDSTHDVQAYVTYYKFMCPNKEGVYNFVADMYGKIADIPEVDYIHLDYIRFVDVILARGLWDKYGLVMDEEYAVADYCYCDDCVADFKAATGIDIKSVEDPSQVEEWKQFRYDLITKLVNHITETVHAKGKKVSAAVFPGPSIAKQLVRQEWNKWNIDMIFPMNYNDFYLEGPEWIGQVVKEEVESVNGQTPIISGLFICHDWQKKAQIEDPEGHGLIPSEIEEAISGSMENGAAGISIFTPGDMTDEHWAAFKKAIYKDYSKIIG